MPIDTLAGELVDAKLWIPKDKIDGNTIEQIKNVCTVKGVTDVVVMPDCHAGNGATIGTVVKTKDMVMPAPVGVDIGCGMMAVQTNIKRHRLKKKYLQKIHDAIREAIPVGFNSHKEAPVSIINLALWDAFVNYPKSLLQFEEKAMCQLGTLGGGNHFIELSYDQNGLVWIILHSGSRHIGLQIANYYIAAAKDYCKDISFVDKSLSYLDKNSPKFDEYIDALKWAQEYAKVNRRLMMNRIIGILLDKFSSLELRLSISCHHNYVEINDSEFITRKGAISAKLDEWGIIPGAMGSLSFIVQGLGNKEALYSAPHGAGRKMSRTKAKKKYSLSDTKDTMRGIVCELNKNTVDEIRYAYKDINDVMFYSEDLVVPIFTLNQLLNIKG